MGLPSQQIVKGSRGQPVVLGATRNSLVCLARVQGQEVAAKVRRGRVCQLAAVAEVAVMGSAPIVHACSAATSSPLPLRLPCPRQVYELLPGTDCQQLWREVQLLRQSPHERIVPLLGVALAVCRGGQAGGRDRGHVLTV